MNQKKVKLQKTVGIINLIYGIIETLVGILMVVASGLIIEIIGADKNFGELGDLLGVSVIIAGVFVLAIGITFIVLSIKLIKAPKILPDGRISERKGLVIFFMVMDTLFALGSISNLVSGFSVGTIVVFCAYVAAVIVAGMSLKEHHNLPEQQPNNQEQFDSWNNNQQ